MGRLLVRQAIAARPLSKPSADTSRDHARHQQREDDNREGLKDDDHDASRSFSGVTSKNTDSIRSARTR